MANFNALNSAAINAIGEYVPVVASGNLVIMEQVVGEVGVGNLLGAEQLVGLIESGNLLDIEQVVLLRETGSGLLVELEQVTQTVADGILVNILQHVLDTSASDSTFFDRNGWDVIIQIGTEVIDTDKLHGPVVIERKEGAAALAEIVLIPDAGVQDIISYSGKTITIDSRTASGIRRLFTGIVDIPDVKIIDKKIVLRCSDRRVEKINTDQAALVSTVGSYSSEVFKGNDLDVATQLENRLSTTPETLDFDAYGNALVTNLLAKTVPDATLSDSQVFRKEPRISFLSRARLVNSMKIEYKYRYTRLYHWTRNFIWTSPIANNFCLFLQSGYQLTPKTMVTQAITAAEWPIDGNISFTDTPASGWLCGGIGWLGQSTLGYYTQVTDENGNTVSDTSGNPVYTLGFNTGAQNLTTIFCTAATWSAGTRWSQIVEEDYSFTVKAPQSITQYGTIEGYVGTEYETPAETSEWEDYQSYDNEGLGDNFSMDLDLGRAIFYQVQNIMISQAKTSIIKSHRDTRVTFFRTLWSDVELHHTVRVNTGPIQAKGKVFKIKHTLNVLNGEDETEITLALSKSQGAATDNVPAYLPKPTDTTFSPDISTISLGSHYGQDPSTDAAATWTGYAGNITAGFLITFYTSQFIVDTPPVPDEYRQPRSLSGGGSSFDVEIQDDELVITF